MPATTTPLTVLATPSSPGGIAFDEQASDVSPGNDFVNEPGTLLYARNTQAGAIDVIVEADVYGVERTLLQVTIPGSATEHGVRILGPFPPAFNEHGTTQAAKNGRVFVRQATGNDGDLQLCPFRVNRGLAA